MDQIRIDNLEIFARHGVYPEENEKGQLFYVSAVLYTQLRRAGKQDDLELSTNYGEICTFVDAYFKAHVFRLIETAAEQTARQILLHFPLIRELELEVRKPHAPIGLPFESVSVRIQRGWHTCFVAAGSNMGNKESYLENAFRAIEKHSDIRNVRKSELLRTTPYGVTQQEEFLNAVVSLDTLLTPFELLDFLQVLEVDAKRERKEHWGPRTLDLDIIYYDDEIIDTPELTVPHKDMHNRDFVLHPLCQLAPCKRHPILMRTAEEMLQDLKERHVIL